MNISELAETLQLSKTIIGKHIQILEEVNIVKSDFLPAKSGQQKVISLKVDTVNICFPSKLYPAFESIQQEIPIGHFSNFSVTPTCGLATTTEIIGSSDDPRYFWDPQKANASILWFTTGFIEYKIPNLLSKNQKLEMLELSFEASSEFPQSNNVWPSDIYFSLNDSSLGYWTSPGDFSDTRGAYNPIWWPNENNQYGILSKIRLTHHHAYINGQALANKGIDMLDPSSPFWTFRFEVPQDAKNAGGLTLYGKGFGNHDQHILLTTYYSEV